jgi:8-oxo-dGTP diphosphatase
MLLHRHASAGERLDSSSLDRARPLDRIGRADARRLPDVLEPYEITRLVSSPHRRCVDTIRRLAAVRGLEIELRDELAPDAAVAETRALLDDLPDTALVCTHREVIERLFDGKIACEKGGTWILERRGSRRVPVEYVAPPTTVERERRLASFVRSS